MQSGVCDTLVLLAIQPAGPPLKILVNHPMPSHSSCVIMICKALLAGKQSVNNTLETNQADGACVQQPQELSHDSAERGGESGAPGILG